MLCSAGSEIVREGIPWRLEIGMMPISEGNDYPTTTRDEHTRCKHLSAISIRSRCCPPADGMLCYTFPSLCVEPKIPTVAL